MRPMDRLLRAVLQSSICAGTLRITTASGARFTLGDGTGNPAAIRFRSHAAERGILRDPEMKFGEAYMDGSVVVEEGSIADVLAVILRQQRDGKPPLFARPQWFIRYLYRRLLQFNPPPRARRNVAHHYDLNCQLYSLFLDADRQYSCAYFETPDQSLDDAQLAKRRHLAAKLLLAKDQRVLDIGCGWGGLALYLAEFTGARVTGITLSREQHAAASVRAAEKGVSESVEFRLEDYRDVTGRFDRIVSVGMFEHVGVSHYDTFFRKCAGLLNDDGVMVLHSIGRSEGPNVTNPWIAKYIFPGGYIPALSEVLRAVERSGLLVTDVEVLRLHYALTLRHWRQRFRASWHTAVERYGERFCRMWEFYLAGAETGFRYQNLMVFQVQLTKDQNALPLTRDYCHTAEQEFRARDGRFPPQPVRRVRR